ncbi:MAG: AAA family ATPase [Elusimicrobia bacterium]|nr:AAA family ATPase [Elusimicrobiota bacterium]
MKLYVAATRQNDGKTMASLGLLAALRKRVPKIGYMKPVGQHYIEINGDKIDKDAVLMKRIYNLDGDLADMSPVAIPKGFTENYILHGRRSVLAAKIRKACRKLCAGKDLMLIEGTGHAGVGSVFDMSNSDVAKLLGAKVILVSCGGIGRPIDEIMLNKTMFDRDGVEVIGVIINKVEKDKFDKINRFARLGLKRKKMDVLGVIPFDISLSSPTMDELLEDLDGEVLCGGKGLKNSTGRMVIGAMPPHEALNYLSPGCLLITPGNRDDLILAALSTSVIGNDKSQAVSGVVLTCGIRPHPSTLRLIKHVEDIPIIVVPHDTFATASRINRTVFKIRPEEKEKIDEAGRLIEKYVDIDRILSEINPR